MSTFKNYSEIEKFFNSKLQQAMEITRDEVFKIVSQKVSDYYHEPVFDESDTPMYERTYRLRNELISDPVKYDNNMYSFTVGWDDEYISYTYPGWEKRWGRGLGGINRATGDDVLTYFNTGRHGGGGFTGDHNYWDEALEEIESRGGIDNILKKNLKKLGISIK